MADKDNHGRGEICCGVIEKAAHLAPQEVTEADLKAINKFALVPLTAEQVFTFKSVLCDNETDRTYERFSLTAARTTRWPASMPRNWCRPTRRPNPGSSTLSWWQSAIWCAPPEMLT